MNNAHEDFSVHVTVGTAAAERASGADVDHDTIIRISSEARRARAAPVGGGWMPWAR